MGKRNLYLNNTPVEEAKALLPESTGGIIKTQGRMDSRDGKSAPDYKRGSLCEILFSALQCGGDGWNRG